MTDCSSKIAKIKLIILDVDGVMTDGSIILGNSWQEFKVFYDKDGSAMCWAIRAGLKVALITGRESEAVKHRAQELGIEKALQGCKKKLEALQELLDFYQLKADQVAYLGDDLIDLPVIKRVGFSAAVADAAEEVLQEADYICSKEGGRGAVRELIELILKEQGKWEEIIKAYLE